MVESTYSKFAFRYYIDYLLLKKQCIYMNFEIQLFDSVQITNSISWMCPNQTLTTFNSLIDFKSKTWGTQTQDEN